MPKFQLNNSFYNIPDDIVNQFKQDNPDAILVEEPGKTTPTTPGAVVEETAAPDTDSKSAGTSLELQKDKPNILQSLAARTARGFASTFRGLQAVPENIIFALGSAGMNTEEKKAFRVALSTGIPGTSVVTTGQYDNLINDINNYVRKTENESVTEAISKGNIAEAAELTVGGALESAPSVLAAMTGYGGIALFGSSVAGNKFDEEFKENPERSTALLAANAIGSGAIEATFELATRGLLKQFGIVQAKSGKEAAKKLLEKGVSSFLKKTGVAYTKEAGSEAATELTQILFDKATLGKDVDLGEAFTRVADAGIIGGFMGGTISTVAQIGDTNTGARNRAEYILTPEAQKQKMKAAAAKISNLAVDLKAAEGEAAEIIKKEILKEENNIINIKKQNSLNLKLLEKDQLQKYASNIDAINKNKNIEGPDSAIELAKIEIDNLTKQNDEILELAKSQKLQKSIEFAETVGAKIGKNIRTLSNKDVISEFGEEAKGADGFVDGNEIIINKDIAKEATAVTVGSHEILHPILESALKGKDQQRIINEFKNIIGAEQLAVVEERLNKNYKADYIAKNQDEYVTAFSDAILKGEIKYNDNIFTKLGDLIRPILRKFGFSKIKFNTGRDVYNFLKDYNKSVFKGDVSQDIIDIVKGIEEEVQKFSRSKEASDRVQEIYEAQGAANAFDIIAEFKPIVDKIVNKYRDVPGFEYQLLKDEIETGKRGILDMIMDYTPEKAKGAPLAAYINKFLPARAIEAANRILDTEFKADVTEAKGVTDTATQEAIEEKPLKELTSLRKTIGINDEIKPVVFNAVRKTFGTRLPSIDDKTFRKELEKRYRTELKKPIAKLFGKGEDYRSFLSNNFESIYNALPQSIFNKRLKEFAEPVLDKDGNQLRERTAEGNKVFTKKKISKAEFIKYFLGDDVKRSTQGTRKTAIVEAVAEAFAFDATMEVLSEPEVLEKAQGIAELQGTPLPDNFIEQISLKVGRPPSFKFSRTYISSQAEKHGFEYYDLLNKENIDKQVAAIASVVSRPDYPPGLFTASMFHYEDAIFNDDKKLKKYYYRELEKIDFGKSERIKGNITKFGKSTAAGIFGSVFEGEQNRSKEKIQAYNIKNGLMFDTFWNYLYDISNDSEFNISPLNVLYMVASSSHSRNHPHALGARIVSIGKNKSGDILWEHAVQNKWAFNFLFDSIQTKNKEDFNKDLKALKKNYTLIGLSKVENDKITAAGYKDEMPLIDGKEWSVYNNFWWQRYLNKEVNEIDGGIDVSNQQWFDESENPFEKYNSSGVQIKASRSLNKEFNQQILEATTGVPFYETFSPVKARLMGKGKGKKFFVPYSADDFVGLLYATLGKREVGDQQMEWYQQNLLRPFSRGIQQYEASKQRALRDWMVLKKEAAKDVPGGLNKTNDSGFTNQNSVRVYIWNKQGMDIPGMKESDISSNLKAVNDDPKLKEFGDKLIALNPEGYPEPSKEWDSGDITTDLVTYINDVKRSEFLTEWKENVDEIFNDQNKNKLRALYGDRFVEALEDIITRMKTGRNRRNVASRTENAVMNWTNNSVGAIMFFNARSAVLQTLSMVNFINFSDNNPINAGAALANFPQYVKDFATLFNSDFLKQRRTGLQTDVNADEIAKAAATAENKARAILSSLLKFGFTPTQIADSFAIASGGATFYRNRIKTYKKQGLEQGEAEAKAFTDFQEIAEETQQSARPDRISMQQAGSLGRIILAFANTPMQYARLTKKAALDLYNGRGDWKTNLSKIAYYSVIQNIIFSALQQGLFALLFDDEEEDKEKERYFRMANSSLDTLLRGTGVYGAGVATVKNVILEIIEQQKSKRPDYTKVVIEATSFSPPINSKLRKLESAGKVFTYKQSREKVYTEGFSLENPAFLAAGKVISAGTNLPADRVVQKAQHLKTAFEPETELWQSIALAMGWSEWDLGMIEKQTKKEKKPKVGFKTKKFKSGFKTKKFKTK